MDYLLHILVMVSIYAILATSLNLLVGFAGLFALSHAAFFGVGAYATAILAKDYGVPFPLPMLAGVVVAAVLGAVVAVPALRIGGDSLVVVTLALQIIVAAVMLNWRGLTGGTDGITGIPRLVVLGHPLDSPLTFLPLSVAVAALCTWLALKVGRSPFGRALRAMRENESATIAIGKDVVVMKLAVFAISAGLASVAGGLLAQYISVVSADTFTIDLTVYMLAMVILGGAGNVWGSLLGAVILTVLPELLKFVDLPADFADKCREILYGLLLILMLAVRPQGILGGAVQRTRSVAGQGGAIGGVAPLPPGTVTLSGRGLRKRFGGIVGLAELDIDLQAGRVIGLIGPNGAGKTTAFNLLTGFLRPDHGEVTLGGRVISGLRPHQLVRAGVARSFQDLRLFTRMTVFENILVSLPGQIGDHLGAVFLTPWRVRRQEAENAARAMAVLRFVGLDSKADVTAENLGYAEEKLLVIARLLATGAGVLLFDEPLSGLDPATVDEIVPVIRKLARDGRTVCIIEHNLDVIRDLCDWVFFLDEGRKIGEGTPASLMNDAALAERYFG